MDTELLVDQKFGDAERLIRQLDRDGFDVSVAVWVKRRDRRLWSLYIGSDSIDTERNLGDAYKRLNASLVKIPEASISIAGVKLVNTTDPIAQAAIRIRDQLPGKMTAPMHAQSLGGLAVDEIYIYPNVGPMSAREIAETVVDLMARRGLAQPSRATLRDGSTIVGVPYHITNAGKTVQIELQDASGANHTIPLDQIASIQ